jgi:hypothetical protein
MHFLSSQAPPQHVMAPPLLLPGIYNVQRPVSCDETEARTEGLLQCS